MSDQIAEVIDGSDTDKVDCTSLYSRRCLKCNDPFNISSFNQLKTKFLYLVDDNISCPATYKKMGEIIKSIEKKGTVTCDDIFKIERGMVRLKTLNDVKHDLSYAREKLRTIVGEKNYMKYLRDSQNNSGKDDEIRDELDYVLGELHLHYSIYPSSEKLKFILLVSCLIISVFIIMPLLFYLRGFGEVTLEMFIIALVAGAFGGFVSVLHKMHDMPLQIDATACFMHLKHGFFSVLLAPVSGSVFAAIAFFLIYSGMISGNIFPNLQIALKASNLDNAEVMKLIILSFLAGFAERLVPDALDKMIKRHQIEKARIEEGHS